VSLMLPVSWRWPSVCLSPLHLSIFCTSIFSPQSLAIAQLGTTTVFAVTSPRSDYQ
jgi:hypothetical protein